METRLFLICFEAFAADDAPAGALELVLEARDVEDATERGRLRLDELAATAALSGVARVHATAVVALERPQLASGVLVSHARASGLAASGAPPFWARRDPARPLWNLYWCSTDDHDEDWFVVATTLEEAATFHEQAEGYNEDDASAELICALPAPLQAEAERCGPHWPSEHALLACGAVFLPNAPQDGAGALRAMMGSGARVVRICGVVYGEGDILAGARRRRVDPARS